MQRHCPALFISAPASGQGKTTVTAALAYRHRQLGRRVRVFKTGPDFLDPTVLEAASGNPVYQLDLWMGDETHCRRLLYDAAGEADLILIEGVMGLFDGKPSSADLAELFGIPILAVIDAPAMAQTFGAIAFGLARYRPSLNVIGVVANRLGGEGHYRLLANDTVGDSTPVLGWLARRDDIALPERHLGLWHATEIPDLVRRIEQSAINLKLQNRNLPPSVVFETDAISPPPQTLAGVRIAIARDAAFSFLYRANIDALHALGAELIFFSPLANEPIPAADSLYLPGGYPELHMEALQNNRNAADSIRRHYGSGKPIYAECGGMLYLLNRLTDDRGNEAHMLGLVSGNATVQKQLSAIAMQEIQLPEGILRGQTFHHSRLESTLTPIAHGTCPHGSNTREAVYRIGRLTASYIHCYFPSNLEATARLFAP